MVHSLNSIIEKLDFKSNQKVADIFGCTRANIGKRRQEGSPISMEEIYILYDHALKVGWYNKIAVLQPLVDEAFPRLRMTGKMLAEFTVRPWQHLVIFLPSLEDAKAVCELLSRDLRFTEEKRAVTLYVPPSGKLQKQIIALFGDRSKLRLRYELTVYYTDNFPFLSGLLIVDGNLLLQPSSTGFVPFGDIAAERHFEEAESVTKGAQTPAYGPVFVQSVGAPPERLPGASDGDSIEIHYTGQLGGTYRLTVTCDNLPDNTQQWRLKLAARGSETVDIKEIEVFDQTGRVIIKTRSNNLPWQGIWSDQNSHLTVHLDELLLTEFVPDEEFAAP